MTDPAEREAYEEYLQDHHEPCLWEDECTLEMRRRCRYRLCEERREKDDTRKSVRRG